MKNTKQFGVFALAALLLTGCSTVNTQVPNGSEVLMTIGDKTYTKEDEYQLIRNVNGPSLALQATLQLIYNEEVPVNDEIKEEAKKMYEQYSSSSEDFEKQLQSYGYKDSQDYIDTILVPSIQESKLKEKYFTDGQVGIEATYHPVLAAIVACNSEDNAKKAQEALKNGDSPAEVFKQYGKEGETNFVGTEEIVLKNNTLLPTRLVNTLSETTQDGVLDEIFETETETSNKSYYVVKIISTDYEKNLDAIKTALLNEPDIATDSTVFYLSKYNFEVHDQYLFDYWKVMNPEYLVSRPDLRESAKSTN